MAYITQNKAHTTHNITTPDGSPLSRYSRYETGHITGNYRDMPAVLADSTGFDSMGFDSAVGSIDDRWHVVNVFDSANRYIDSMAIGGAMDSDHAMQVAKTQLDSLGGARCQLITNNAIQFDGIDHDHEWSIDAINKLMSNPSQNKNYLPVITAPELVVESERVTFDSVQWDHNDNLISHGGKESRLYLDLTRADSRNDLVTEFNLADALFDMDAQETGFDALMDTKSRLPLLKDRLFKALSKAGDDDLSVANVTQTKEFKRQGVINIAFVFDLSDGQKLSIWFHKPLESSAKLLPSDYMISWKWMLNKRDVTAALSPKQGDNVQLPALARRIMRVANKNSKRFKSAQARQRQTEQELLEAEQAVADKKATIDQLDTDIADLNSKISAAMQAPTDESKKEDDSQKTKGGIFSEGDPVIWMVNGSEISRGIFKAYSPHNSDMATFIDDGGQMNAPVNQLIFDTDAQLSDEQIAAQSQADKYNEIEDIIRSLSNSSKRFKEWDMTIESVKALPKEQFFRLADALAAARLYADEQLLLAYRVGRQDLIDMAQTIMDNEKAAGATTPEITKRRDRLAEILNTELTLVGSKKDAEQAVTPAATAIPIREALDYVKANVFDGKEDQVLMYVTDRQTGEIKESKLVKASSQSAQTRWSNKFRYDDTTGSVYNQSIPKSNINAAVLLEDLGYKIDYADPEGFTDDQFKIGDAYRFTRSKDADDTGIVMQFKEWVYLKRGTDEAGMAFSAFNGATGETIKLSEMQRLVTSGEAVLLTDDEAATAKDYQAEKPVSVYVNSKGRVLATVTEQQGKYSVKGENFSGGNYPDDASVLKQLKVVKKNNASMKLKSGKEFFSADDAGKSYPPVERDKDGNYVAYMNSKKKDSWLAIPKDDGSFTVYADNAQTRAYRNSTPKMFDDVEALLKAYPAFKGIKEMMAEQGDDDGDYEDIDESEYPQMFLDRNKDKLNILGIGDGDIQVGLQDDYDNNSDYEGLYHIDSGLFENQTLNFADAVCKAVDAAISLGADAVVGDFSNTAYQDSMFDGLNSKSNPTYGITVQISKGGIFLRADIDGFGQCKILEGASGTKAIATIKHVFTDNTNEYQSALADALDVKVDDDMTTTETDPVMEPTTGQPPQPITVPVEPPVAEPTNSPNDLDRQEELAIKHIKVIKEMLVHKMAWELIANTGSDIASSEIKTGGSILTHEIKRTQDMPIKASVKWGIKDTDIIITDDMSTSYTEIAREIDKAATSVPLDDFNTESAAAKRINEIEQQMSAADFDPMAVDTDELIDLVDQVEDDAALSAKLDAISVTLQQKMVAISMKALTDMAGA